MGTYDGAEMWGSYVGLKFVVGSYDGTEICELVGLFILNYLGKSFGKENIGLYRDDGLAIIKNKSARLAAKTFVQIMSGYI